MIAPTFVPRLRSTWPETVCTPKKSAPSAQRFATHAQLIVTNLRMNIAKSAQMNAVNVQMNAVKWLRNKEGDEAPLFKIKINNKYRLIVLS